MPKKVLTPEEKAAKKAARVAAKTTKATGQPAANTASLEGSGNEQTVAGPHTANAAGVVSAPAVDPTLSSVKVEGSPTTYVVVHHHNHKYHAPHKRVFSEAVHGKKFVDLAKSFAVANPQPVALAQQGEKNHVEFISESEAKSIEAENDAKEKAINDRRELQRQHGEKITP